MLILYTPVGTTDPVRNFHDGAMLHIIRKYAPDMVYVFLTKEMATLEERDHRFSIALNYIQAYKNIKFTYKFKTTGIKEPQIMDELEPLLEGFEYLKTAYPDAEYLINISSGTPQMKSILTYIAMENANTTAIQVYSPENKSNKNAHPAADDDDLETLLETNEDNEADAPDRCRKVSYKMLKRFYFNREILQLTGSYEYKRALDLYNANKGIIPDEVGKLLKHATARMNLQFAKAFDGTKGISKELYSYINNSNDFYKNKNELINELKLLELYEYFMVMEVNIKKKLFMEFMVKLVPFCYELSLYVIKRRFKNGEIYLNKYNGAYKIDSTKISAELAACLNGNRAYDYNKDLYFGTILTLIHGVGQDEELYNELKPLTNIISIYRNKFAHTIVTEFSEATIQNDGISVREIISRLRNALEYVTKKKIDRNVYDKINDDIKIQLSI